MLLMTKKQEKDKERERKEKTRMVYSGDPDFIPPWKQRQQERMQVKQAQYSGHPQQQPHQYPPSHAPPFFGRPQQQHPQQQQAYNPAHGAHGVHQLEIGVSNTGENPRPTSGCSHHLLGLRSSQSCG